MADAMQPQLPRLLQLRKLYVGRMVHESPPTSVEIWYGGKAACHGVDDGSGGGMYFRTLDRQVETQLQTDIAALAPEMPDADWDATSRSLWPAGRKWDLEQFVWAEIARVQKAKQYARWCRKDTLFRLMGDPPETWRVLKNLPFTSQVAAGLRRKHGAQLEAILNETIHPPLK
ncbi:MAG: hypothetical protein WCI73_05205 [Phycisphaerae bacterium]